MYQKNMDLGFTIIYRSLSLYQVYLFPGSDNKT